MQKKGLGGVLIIVGIIILLISLLADPLGIGGYPGIGTRQTIGIIIGVIIAIIGFIIHRK